MQHKIGRLTVVEQADEEEEEDEDEAESQEQRDPEGSEGVADREEMVEGVERPEEALGDQELANVE